MKDEIPKERLLELLCDYNDFLIANGVVETNCIGKTIEFVNSKYAVVEKPSLPVMPNFAGVSKEDFEHIEVKMVHHKEVFTPSLFEIPKRPIKGICVDVGCQGNPGKAEYRGVDIETNQVVFHVHIPGLATNNTGEYLGAVAGLEYALKKNDKDYKVWSDSLTAISWVRQKNCKTKRAVNNEQQIGMIRDAHNFLMQNGGKVHHWQTKLWGEIIADFGRKK